MIAKIFGSKDWILFEWHGPEVGGSSGHYLLQAYDDVFRVESEATWKDESRHNVSITYDHCKQHHVDKVFGFH